VTDSVATFAKAFIKALDDLTSEEPQAPRNPAPTEFRVVNHRDFLIVYQGEEQVAKIKPEHADQLVGELSLALRKQRGEYND